MAAGAVLTPTVDPSAAGSILTFLTPGGCGMACSYCFIDRRREPTAEGGLRPRDFARFIRDAADLRRIAAVTIQGREPLEPDSLAWTEAILAAGTEIGAETGLVTNGLWLERSVPLLGAWGCSGVTVSIDADTPEVHDRLRRTPGAWARAMAGLRALVDHGATPRVAVNSLVFKGASDRLADLPRHLAAAGVELWSLSPMLRFDTAGRPAAAITSRQWVDAIRFLSERAAQHGVTVIADDEFRCMGESVIPGVTVRTLCRPEGIMRMGPDGRCSFGLGILDGGGDRPFLWQPEIHVSDVMEQMVH